jgi:hypothetical protein
MKAPREGIQLDDRPASRAAFGNSTEIEKL